LLQTFEGSFKVFDGKDHALVFRAKYAINTDGAVTSYHKDDIRGQTKAINNICNGVNVTLPNGTSLPGGSNATCPGLRTAFAQARDLGWQAAAAPRVDFFAIAKKTCNAQRKCVPCETADGFLVSTTSLENPGVTDVCDPKRYFDSLTLSGIVIPKSGLFINRGARSGDLVMVRSRATGQTFGAIVADTGPAANLGEGTVALALKLRGSSTLPTNFQQVKTLSLTSVDYVVFPGTSAKLAAGDRFDAAKVEQAARAQFDEWGGGTQMDRCLN
jgi:hypothetical protein